MHLRKLTYLFAGTRALEDQIDEFFDKVTEAGLVFEKAVAIYLAEGLNGTYDAFLDQVQAIESREDALRRSIESELFARTLIPDLRADVMTMLEDTDGIVNMFQANLFRLSIQQPDIPTEFHAGLRDLTETAITCVDSAVLAARAFFRDIEGGARSHDAHHLPGIGGRQAEHSTAALGVLVGSSARAQDAHPLLHRAYRRCRQRGRRPGRHSTDLHHQAPRLVDLAALFLLSSGLFLGWSLGANDAAFLDAFGERAAATSAAVERRALALSEIGDFHIDVKQVYRIEEGRLGPGQIEAIEELAGTRFRYRWALAEALAAHTDEWVYLPESPLNRKHNKQLRRRLEYVLRHFDRRNDRRRTGRHP